MVTRANRGAIVRTDAGADADSAAEDASIANIGVQQGGAPRSRLVLHAVARLAACSARRAAWPSNKPFARIATIGLVELAGGGTGQYRHPAPVHRLVDDPRPKRRLAARGAGTARPSDCALWRECLDHHRLRRAVSENRPIARRVVDSAGLVLINRLQPALKALSLIEHEDLTLRGSAIGSNAVQLPHDDLNRKSEEEQGELARPFIGRMLPLVPYGC